MAIEEDSFLDSDQMTRAVMRKFIHANGTSSFTLVARSDENYVIGTIMVTTPRNKANRFNSRLYSYAVGAGRRGHGVGAALIESACYMARTGFGRNMMRAEVRADNYYGLKRIEASGFKVVGSEANWYPDGCAGFFYVRPLL